MICNAKEIDFVSQIIGPGDSLFIHDDEEEIILKEIANEAAVGNDVGHFVLSTPILQREWQFVVLNVCRFEGLPVMDVKVILVGILSTKYLQLFNGNNLYCTFQYKYEL